MFSLFDVLLLIGISQGLLTSVLLFRAKKNRTSNTFLACGILSFCLLCGKMLLFSTGLAYTSFLRHFPLGLELSHAPLFYLYLTSLTNPEFKVRPRTCLHFIPFALSQGFAFLVYFNTIGIQDMAQKEVVANSLYYYEIKKAEDYLALLSIVVYLSLAYRHLRNFRQSIDAATSDNSYPTFQWLFNIFKLSAVLGVWLCLNLSLDYFLQLNESSRIHWQLYMIYIAGVVYYLGFAGYRQPDLTLLAKIDKPKPTPKAKLADDQRAEIAAKIRNALDEEKLFLDPELSSQQLAKHIGVSVNNISLVVNTEFQQSFRDLVNSRRVDEVKQQLLDPSFQGQSTLAIALNAGFNSEASFYRVFKKFNGQSPREFISAQRAS